MSLLFLLYKFTEVLRLYPPAANLIRRTTKTYTEPGTKIVFPVDSLVIIPSYAIHRDPEYYPNPEKFDPNRFTTDEIKKRDPCLYLPFGEGPRICVGIRFGMLQARVGLAMLMYNFKFSTNSKTRMVFSSNDIVLTTDSGLWLQITRLRNN